MRRSRRTPARAFRRTTSRRRRCGCSRSSRACAARGGSSRWARSAATARSGSRAGSPPADGLCRWSATPRADVARGNLARAGLADVVEVRAGPALEALPVLAEGRGGSFDLVFVDADKESAAEYARWALRLTAPGSAIVFDNVVRGGALADADSDDARVRGVRALHEALAGAPGVCATTVQTVGAKGYDGFTLALVGG